MVDRTVVDRIIERWSMGRVDRTVFDRTVVDRTVVIGLW